MNDKLNQLSEEFFEKAQQIESKLEQIRSEVAEAERVAHARGFKEGLAAQSLDFDGKTIVVKVPEDQISSSVDGIYKLGRQLNCKFVVLAEYSDLKDLHELELKAIGLKKIEE